MGGAGLREAWAGGGAEGGGRRRCGRAEAREEEEQVGRWRWHRKGEEGGGAS